jgi:hypothetical protein
MRLVAAATRTLLHFAVLCALRLRFDRAEHRPPQRIRNTPDFGRRSAEIEARGLRLLKELLNRTSSGGG